MQRKREENSERGRGKRMQRVSVGRARMKECSEGERDAKKEEGK